MPVRMQTWQPHLRAAFVNQPAGSLKPQSAAYDRFVPAAVPPAQRVRLSRGEVMQLHDEHPPTYRFSVPD